MGLPASRSLNTRLICCCCCGCTVPGLYLSFKALRGDLKTVREENPHLVSGTTFMARKMGFPEIILPGDVRNDLYLTVLQAEFARGGVKTGGNIQVRTAARGLHLRTFSLTTA